MKFLTELGSCYRSVRSSKQRQDLGEIRASVRSSNSGRQWRPALVAISEDGTAASAREGKLDQKLISSSQKGRSKAKAQSSSDDHQLYRRSNVSFIPAAFAATPFMF